MENEFDLHKNLSKNELLSLLESHVKTNIHLESKNNKLESQNNKLEQENSYLKFQLEQFKRAMFGSKSERFISDANQDQLSLPFEVDEQEVLEEVQKVVEQISYEREKKRRENHPGRLALPSHLPVVEVVLEPEEDVEGMKFIGTEITDELEYTPGKCFIKRYIRNKYISAENELGNQEVKIATLDFRPIDKCIAGPNLLSQIVVDKYVDHLPIYRQLQRFARDGIEIKTSTIESWQKLIAKKLEPLYESHLQYTLRSGYIQVDESPIKVQDREKKGATHQGYMWVYHSPMLKSVLFDYQKGRGCEGIVHLLAGFKGYLQSDGYSVYDQFMLKKEITHLGCWAHARRYFEKALEYNKLDASHVLILIQKLYQIEREIKEKELSLDEIKMKRINESLPVLNQIGSFIAVKSKLELPKSPLGKAYAYCLNRWDSMLNYLKDGNLQIDNNLIENAIRPLALGRKNYLFAGSHDAAKNIAMYYSFFATCKKNNINPQKWLVYVLENINQTELKDIHTLLPQNINVESLVG
jgi:transposase